MIRNRVLAGLNQVKFNTKPYDSVILKLFFIILVVVASIKEGLL